MTKTSKHKAATRKYKQSLLDEHGYMFCELCLTNNTLAWSVHHIYTAGRYPKHKELNNPLNLILLCIDCHAGFHEHKKNTEFDILEKDRELKKLFDKQEII